MEPAPDKNESRWSQLPRHYWGLIGRSKPGATPLAYVREDGARPVAARFGRAEARHGPNGPPQGPSPPLEEEKARVVRHTDAFGRVLFIGLESTWRWRYKAGDQYHHRFWGQVVRWAASDKPLVTGNQHVRFGTREALYRQGQEIEVLVQLGEEASRFG